MSEHEEFEVSVDGYFAILPEWIIDAEISDRAVRLYAVLRRFANGELKARPSRSKLAIRLRTSLSSIDRALRELQVIGAITVRHRWTNSVCSSFTYAKDSDHQTRAANGYVLHNVPARTLSVAGGGVTGDATPLVTGDATPSSPVTTPLVSPMTRGVASPMTRGVVSPVTHELKPEEPKPEGKRSSSSAKPPRRPEPRRDDVEALCTRLRDLVVANGSRATITEAWRREARLLLDKDGRDLGKALNLIDWCQRDHFWHKNVLSMPKFREKYDQLRLNALDEHQRRSSPAQSATPKSDQKVANILEIGSRLMSENPSELKEITR